VSISEGCFTISASCQHPLAQHHLRELLPADCGACDTRAPIPGPIGRC
jgi:hypothetical protein